MGSKGGGTRDRECGAPERLPGGPHCGKLCHISGKRESLAAVNFPAWIKKSDVLLALLVKSGLTTRWQMNRGHTWTHLPFLGLTGLHADVS